MAIKFADIRDRSGHNLNEPTNKANPMFVRPHEATGERGNRDRPEIGIALVHNVIDDHSRGLPRSNPTTKQSPPSAALQRAVARSADHGVPVELVLSDNGLAYKSCA